MTSYHGSCIATRDKAGLIAEQSTRIQWFTLHLSKNLERKGTSWRKRIRMSHLLGFLIKNCVAWFWSQSTLYWHETHNKKWLNNNVNVFQWHVGVESYQRYEKVRWSKPQVVLPICRRVCNPTGIRLSPLNCRNWAVLVTPRLTHIIHWVILHFPFFCCSCDLRFLPGENTLTVLLHAMPLSCDAWLKCGASCALTTRRVTGYHHERQPPVTSRYITTSNLFDMPLIGSLDWRRNARTQASCILRASRRGDYRMQRARIHRNLVNSTLIEAAAIASAPEVIESKLSCVWQLTVERLTS